MTRDKASTRPFRVLASNAGIGRLLGAFLCVTLAEWAYVTALAVDAFRQGGSVAVAVVGVRLFVAAVSGLVGPALVPGRARGWMLTVIAAARAIGLGLSTVMSVSGAPLALLLVMLAVDSALLAQYRPAQSAVLPALARTPQELIAAISALSTVKSLSQGLGAVLGGFLLAVVSPSAVFAGATAVLLVAGLLTQGLTVPAGELTLRRPLGAVVEDVARFGTEGDVGGVLLVSGVRTLVRGMWTAVAVIASLDLLHAGATGVGFLMLGGAVGALIAAPLSSWLVTHSRIGTPTALALLACGVPLAVVAVVPRLGLAVPLITIWGVGMALSDVATSSLMYRLLDIPALPRFTSVLESLKLALEGLGGFIAPMLTVVIGVRGTLVVAAAPMAVVVVAGWRMLHRVDATAGQRASTLEMLHRVPLLAPLEMGALDGLLNRIEVEEIAEAGTLVVRQGEAGDRFYVIATGQAEVLIDGWVVGWLGPGDSFGERALLRHATRSATIRSQTPLGLLSLPRAAFLSALTGSDDHPGHYDGLGTQGATDDHVAVLSRLSLFSHLDDPTLHELASQASTVHWSQGVDVVAQGEEGDCLHVLLEGRAVVTVDGRQVGEVAPGDSFGEIAVLHGVPRQATVTAVVPSTTLRLGAGMIPSAMRSRVLGG